MSVGFNIGDPASQGYHVERDERANVEPGEHAVKRAVAVDRRNPEGDYHTKDRSRGDVQPRLLWQNATGRAIPSWGAAWPAAIHEAQKDGAPGAGGTQGVGARSASVLPVRDRGVNDDRYEPIVGPYRPPWASYLPRDWTGVLVPASDETQQTEVFIPAAHGLVTSHMGDPKLSTAVVDLAPDDRVDGSRRALLRSHLRVVKLPLGTTPGRIGGLSWWIGNAGIGGAGGGAVGVQPGRIGDTRSGYVTDIAPPNGLATTSRGAPDPVVHGLASCNHGGPLDVGGLNDRHRIGVDEDGNPINPLHISTNALFRSPESGSPGSLKSGTDRDGPLLFEPGKPPVVKLGSGIARRVHLQFDDQSGKWLWWSEDEIDDDYIPPKTPPPPLQPQPRKIAGALKSERPLLGVRREIAFNSIVLRPQSYAPGEPDLRNHVGPVDEATAARYARMPVVGRIEAAATRGGGGVGALPTYTYAPGNARYKGGTASGVIAYLPPEVGLEDEATDFAPTGVTLSTVHHVYHKGKVLHGSGLPDVKAGLTKSGYTWGANATTGAMEWHERSSTGAITTTQTVAKVTGTVPSASSITANALPKFSGAAGAIAPSAIGDDGTNVKADSRIVDLTNATRLTTAKVARAHTTLPAADTGMSSWADDFDPVHTLFIDASSLTTSCTVTLPDPTTAPRELAVKITKTGAGTVDFDSDGGGKVENGTSYSLDATARSKVVFRSDGSNWWVC